MNVLYIILKNAEILKFRDFMNTLRNFTKSVFAHIFAKFEYFAKVIIYSNHQTTCFKMIYSTFIILKFEIFRTAVSESLRSHFAKITHKNREIKIFFKY